MIPLSWLETAGLRSAAVDSANWLSHVQLWRPAENPKIRTGEVETAAVILHGTFDLIAAEPGGTANQWQARGARTSPFEGRPMAVFLPPNTEFEAANGDGEILLVGARQPASKPVVEAQEALSQSPLLPLAGSGKAFDPKSGEWKPTETFPSSAESLPPRRMQRLAVGDTAIERVFPADYKAATLTIDEIVLAPGTKIAVQQIDGRPPHGELLVFVRSGGEIELRCGGETWRRESRPGDGDIAFLMPTPGGDTDLEICASGESAYLLLAYAGK